MSEPPPSQQLLATAASSPLWFPFAIDVASDRVLMVRKEEADYRAASFLDQRSLSPGAESWIADWHTLAAAIVPDARRDVQYIFHIGHVGSTLVSRLLGEIETILSLREPLVLRTFAELLGPLRPQGGWRESDQEARTGVLTALVSRTFRPRQRALVKATSFTSEIAYRLLPAQSRALFLYATPRNYIQGILAGDGSRQELRILAPVRLERLRTRLPGLDWRLEAMTEAQLAAAAWACEMTSLVANAAAIPGDTVLWLDFDRFLDNPAGHLQHVAGFLGAPIDDRLAASLASGPLMRRYSKALEYEYSPQLRRDLLAQAQQMHGRDIDFAVGWLSAEARRLPIVAEALGRAS